MIIMKFGGTSVGDADRIANVANIVKSNIKRKPIVVVSAVTKITDALIRLGKESAQGKGHETLEHIRKTHFEIIERLGIGKELLNGDLNELERLAGQIRSSNGINEKTLDHIQSFGERMSSKIVASQLNKIGIESQSFDSWQLGFLTNDEFGEAEPLDASYSYLNKNIKKLDIVPVITGFIGKTEKGEITTLGRGGSDYTAAIIGAAVDADEIQIWTDVNGVMSTDPKIVANARTLEKVSFAEASELAYFGARVLHPKTILPAMRKNIPVRVLNSFNPRNKGTIIVNEPYKNRNAVKAIACKKNIILINIESTRMLGAYGFLERLFDIFYKYRKSVDVVSTSEVSVSLTIDNEEHLDDIISELKEISEVNVLNNKAIICVVGEGMRNTPGIAGRTFTSLGKKKINIELISQGASEINITFIVDGKDGERAVKALHNEFYGD